jgi:dipeptidyl aminopeptidase/acylaminoacyl peptidase
MDCLAGNDLTEPRLSPNGRVVAYVRSDSKGARIIARSITERDASDGSHDAAGVDHEWSSPDTVRPGRSLGGGCFNWMADSEHLVAVTSNGDLRLWGFDGRNDVLVERIEGRTISSPESDPDGKRLAVIIDQAEVHEIDIASGAIRRVDDGGFAFVFDPVWVRGRLVWQAWSPPHMPWDESSLVSETGVVRSGLRVQHQQPQTTADGERLGWLDDASGWLNVMIEGVGRIDERYEHGGPTWGERQRSWCFDGTGTRVAFVRNEDGFGRLCTVDLETGVVTERAKAVHGQLSWRGEHLVALRTGGRTPTQVVVYDTSDDEWRRRTIEIGSTHDWSNTEALVEPELVRVSTTEAEPDTLHARLYRSPVSRGRLLCWIHGGPTDQWLVSFMPRITYWIDRGYDVLVPDFRGSTGHGRAYTQALHGRWGDLDVVDVESILNEVMSRDGYSPASTAVLGSSAGGMTALLLAARRPDLIAAAIASYPVGNIAGLDTVTHRFEAHYNRSLIGTAEETVAISAERSPTAHAESLARVPTLIFHGSADPVVPIDQSQHLVSAIRSHGGTVDLVEFEGEGHGFRVLENKIDEYTRTEEFLERHLTDGFAGRHLSVDDHR